MDNVDSQFNFAAVRNIEFEEKVDLETLVLPSKSMNLSKRPLLKELLENGKSIHEERNSAFLESIYDGRKHIKLKMEKDILELYEDLDKEKSENPMMDLSQSRSVKIRQFIETIGGYDNQKMSSEIVSLKTKIAEVTEEHKIAVSQLSLNAKTMNSIVKMHEKAQEALDNKTNELANIKQELESVKVTNQELLQKNKELEIERNTFANNSSLTKNLKSVNVTNQELLQKNQGLEMERNIVANNSSLERNLKNVNVTSQELLEKSKENPVSTYGSKVEKERVETRKKFKKTVKNQFASKKDILKTYQCYFCCCLFTLIYTVYTKVH